MNEFEQHDCVWDDRLQDFLDVSIAAGERATVESHLSSCARCRRRYAELKRIDAQLSATLHSPTLESSFDRQLFARIHALEVRSRDQARRQADRELQENLQVLTRDWRHRIVLLIGGSVAGIAVALAFAGWADAAGVADKLLGTLNEVGTNSDSVRSLLAAAMGAVIGGGISGLLARSVD